MRLFVGNLPFSSTSDQLKELFESVGTVEAVDIIVDKMTNRSRGFGFVDMPDDVAKEAITKLNGAELDGRKIFVSEAKPMKRTER
jgi:RNA recognition motif-containing protein